MLNEFLLCREAKHFILQLFFTVTLLYKQQFLNISVFISKTQNLDAALTKDQQTQLINYMSSTRIY